MGQYFENRMQLLGVTPELNKIALRVYDEKLDKEVLKDFQVFSEVEKGIEILVYTLDRYKITINKEGSRFKKNYVLTRLENPIRKADGSTIKYLIPKGAGTFPFFPPALIDKFERKEQIHTLYLVEGFFKAFKASMHGVDIIGLSSITHMKDKEKKTLHPEIKEIIDKCDVKRIVWLCDGDAIDISSKELTPELDLYTRPNQFFNTVITFRTLLSDYTELEKWFMHIDIDSIRTSFPSLQPDEVKGIDDLLVSMPDKVEEVVADLKSVSGQNRYFEKFNVTYSTSKVHSHFKIGDPKIFYLFHSERRPELKDKEFKFNGTRYRYDVENGELKIMIPSEAKNYFRVGDDYYKFVKVPNQFGTLELQFLPRRKSTIVDDHGKNLPNHIAKFEAFCNIPSHTNYQRVIDACFNVYSPLDILPDEEECSMEDCPDIIALVKHIFGEKLVSYWDRDLGKKMEYPTWHLGMDYLQLLYQKPQQKLPILCLVSKENGTGKSTFGFFLRQMLGANTAIVGNADLANDFNGHWATKNVVVCDETKIDKDAVIEKIKALSTAKKIFMNSKGKNQVELDCFIKFILITNNEDNFIKVSDEDVRYWILKVPVLKQDNPNIMENLVDQLPAFLSLLNKRKMATEMRSRMYFHYDLLRTEAFKKLMEASRPAVEREIRHYLKNIFLDTGLKTIEMTATDIHIEVFNRSSKYDAPYITKIIKDHIKADLYHVWEVEGLASPYDTQELALAAAGVKFPDIDGFLLLAKIQKKYKQKRYTYPRFKTVFDTDNFTIERLEAQGNGRPYVFHRAEFVSEDETRELDLDPKTKYEASIFEKTKAPMVVTQDANGAWKATQIDVDFKD